MSVNKIYYNSYILVFIFLFFYKNVYAQEQKIHTYVVDQAYKPIDYFTAALLDRNDSSIITGGAFVNGNCDLAYNSLTDCLLQISSVSYQSVIFPIDLTMILVDTVVLENNNLEEVTVSSKRPVYSIKNGNLQLNVQSTSLKDLGSSMDVLRRAPGLQIDQDNNITLFGKGTPVIFIDGREIQSNDELNILQSSNINKIEVDRNPSAQYSADSKSVIRIFTKKTIKDQLSVNFYDQLKKSRKWSNRTGISVNQQKGKFVNNFSYQYDLSQIHYYNDDYSYNYQDDYTLANITNSNNQKKSYNHSLMLGSQLDLDSTNKFTLQYQFYGKKSDLNRLTDQYISYSVSEIIKEQELNKNANCKYHNIGLNYTHQFDSINSFIFRTDYSRITDKDKSYIDENNITSSNLVQTKLNNFNIYDVLTLDGGYNVRINNTSINSGLKYSFIHNTGDAQSSDLKTSYMNYDEDQLVTDKISAAYISVDHKWKSLDLNLGLRGELSNTYIQYNGETIKDSTYFNVFPTFSINWHNSDKKSISFIYSSNINRPSFSDLNPTISYYDSLSYAQGNSDLKPSISNNITIRFGLPYNISFSTEYCYITNSIMSISQPDEDNENIIKVSPINQDHTSTLNFNTTYNYSGKKLSIDANAGIEFPFIDIPYLGETYKIRKGYWYFAVNSDLSVGKHLSIWAELYVNSDNTNDITLYSNITNINVGIMASLLKNKLKISLSAIGLSDTGDWSWSNKYGSLKCGGSNDFDNRYISLSIKFNINKFKNILKYSTSNSQEINRL